MTAGYDDFIDEDLIEEEEIPEVKPNKSQAWRDIEAIREQRALEKKLAKEYELESFEDDWDFDDLDD
ncbi:hypothetical protein OXI21_07025 [Ignatzschineria sp. RMDPL8A]|uniref:hypothetical protein n=1 Tax=Ignatzschineria sp. RMDPL8A TaxID=2999236 RepID=UPI0016A0653C|nr:hypothetical protein [Ignatzschineria sp. RMDPL8A]MDG9730160.1 hypothetical protein [Ignatzschineria sp. RMDPL8A]NLD09685.1 hypothetical protein [Xanthomonadaceae bacterium]